MDTLKSMNLTLIENAGYVPSYTRKDITDDLHQLFGYRTDYQNANATSFLKEALTTNKKNKSPK